MRAPARGQIWFVDLNPTAGPSHEPSQQGSRPVFVVSDRAFNRLGLCVVCPITRGVQQSRFAGFAVTPMGTGSETQGVVMCNQPRTIDIDITAHSGRFVETLGADVVDEVFARLKPIFEVGG
jgi:mRNA interferase ChpB